MDKKPGFYVYRTRCATCVFSPRSPISLERYKDLILSMSKQGKERFLKCHSGSGACCRGFFDTFPDHTQVQQVAARLQQLTGQTFIHFVEHKADKCDAT